MQTVRSAICVRQNDGSLEQVVLGSYPMGGIPEAEEALAAAVAAYDDGRGEWPTMTVARAHRLHAGLHEADDRPARETVKLIMWEIGKNLPDCKRSSTAPSTISRRPSRR